MRGYAFNAKGAVSCESAAGPHTGRIRPQAKQIRRDEPGPSAPRKLTLNQTPVITVRVHSRGKSVGQRRCGGIVSSNLTPSAPNFRFAIADFRLVPGENAPLAQHRKSPAPLRRQRRRDNVRRCTSARIRSESGLGDRRDRRAGEQKLRRQKMLLRPQRARKETRDISC